MPIDRPVERMFVDLLAVGLGAVKACALERRISANHPSPTYPLLPFLPLLPFAYLRFLCGNYKKPFSRSMSLANGVKLALTVFIRFLH